MLRTLFAVLFATSFLAPASLRAADPAPAEAESPVEAGHSFHGEAFNEGARQRAYLMEGTGNVSFPCSTKNELAQKFINQGVGQLHGFWYFEAERSFRQAAALDDKCAIAYWGMAMANSGNSKRAKEFILEARKRKAHASDRERRYIDAHYDYLNPKKSKDKDDKTNDKDNRKKYVKALEKIVHEYPDDLEAKAFLAYRCYADRRVVPMRSSLLLNAFLNEILAANPLHPVHHYRIHLWDYEKAELALDSAAKCGASAPGIAHMWHMPGHIYSRLKRYGDAVWQQEASARVDHAHMIRDRVLPDQIHNFAHNNEWLTRNLLNIGRVHDAIALAKNMIELPRHPKYNEPGKRGTSSYYGRLRLFTVLSTAEMWDELIRLCHSAYLEPTDSSSAQISRLRYLGRAYFRSGDVESGKRILAEVTAREVKEKAKQTEAQTKAENKAKADATKRKEKDAKKIQKEVSKAKSLARRPFAANLRNLANALNEFKGYLALAEGKPKAAYPLLKKAGTFDPFFVADVQAQTGDVKGGEKSLTSQLTRKKNETVPLAHLARFQWKHKRVKEAKQTIAKLRELSGAMDLDAPVFAALSPLAKEMGWKEDWRKQKPRAKNFGERPELDSLGPFRWHPSRAESWSLPDVHGKSHSLNEFAGRPVVVIFYLGAGCLHCAEQLQAFAPKAKQFEEAGLDVICISTDDQANLQRSLDNYKDGDFPFTLVSDVKMDVFKQYRVYDDFEDLPLHGTFLIDGNGLVRWHDISYEPFMKPDFVLDEAKRLLDPFATPATLVTTMKPQTPAIAEKPE